MKDSISLKMKPSAAVLMALALITTTFAGVTYADPADGSGAGSTNGGNSNMSDTMISIDYDSLVVYVDQYNNGSAVGTMSALLTIYDAGSEIWNATEDLVMESDNTSWNTHYTSFNLTLFFEGNDTIGPMAEEGTWYSVNAEVVDSYQNWLGSDYMEICMENGSVCEVDDHMDEVTKLFEDMDENGDNAVNASEMIDYFNWENADDANSSNMTDDEEAEVADMIADFDFGYDDGMGNTEDAYDGMLEFNEFADWFFSVYMITGADAYLEDGMLLIEIHDDFEEIDYVWIQVFDQNGVELVNETYNGSEDGEFYDWTSSDCCAEDGMYYSVMITFYDEEGYMIAMYSTMLGEMMDQDEMIFGMYDADESGNVSFDEFMDMLNIGGDNDSEGPDNQTIALFQSLFMSSDSNNDSELNLDEFMYFMELLDGDGEEDNDDDTDFEFMFMMFDTDASGNVSWSEYLDFMVSSSDEAPSNETLMMMQMLFLSSDLNNDSELDLDEFMNFMSAFEDDDDDSDDSNDIDVLMMMLDVNQDGHVSLSEMLSMFIDEEMSQEEATQWTTVYTNVFNIHDEDGNELLDEFEFAELFYHMQELDTEKCYDIMEGETVMDQGEFEDADGDVIELYPGDTAPSDGEFCFDVGTGIELMILMADTDGSGTLSMTEVMAIMGMGEELSDEELVIYGWVFDYYDYNDDMELDMFELIGFMDEMNDDSDYEPTEEQLMEVMMMQADTDGDGSISMSEMMAMLTEDGENLSAVEEEYFTIAFMMADSDGNQLLDMEEFMQIMFFMDSDDGDEGDMDDGNSDMVVGLNEEECLAAGGEFHTNEVDENNNVYPDHCHLPDTDEDHHDEHDADEEEGIEFYDTDVWFEQWNDETMQLVIVELSVIDNPEEIARLVMTADEMYGNNDAILNESEVEMLMGLYALSFNPQDVANGLTLDGQNGTAVDFWVEIDGLLEGEDVVFLRIGTVLEFPTTPYETATTRTFKVTPETHDDEDSNDTMTDCNEESGVWIHNSETWDISTVSDSASSLEFVYDETNNMWYNINDDCSEPGTVTFTLKKAENGTIPTQEDDWTWEDEEMNMLPICDWYYAVTFANGSMMEDQWMEEAPVSGDYMMTLADNASYDIFVSCWDPEGGEMTVDITSPLGNSSNTSIGHAMGYVSFKLPAGTGGNVTFGVAWTDGYHSESGNLTVIATGDGSIDLSDITTQDSEGLLPGFTAGLGVLAMLGAAMLAGRRD
tara:strand:+ start:22815 stop:26513 length:3699 start_codon:yes stop_codon:yes gene_type:complete